MATLLKQENAEISEMEQQVIESIAKNELLSKDLEEELKQRPDPWSACGRQDCQFWRQLDIYWLFLFVPASLDVCEPFCSDQKAI
jgi:hypothetical protein